MEYLQNKEYFPFIIVIIDDSLQITLVVKKIKSVIWNLFDFITYLYSYYSQFHETIHFSFKYFIWTRGGRHHKLPMNPKH